MWVNEQKVAYFFTSKEFCYNVKNKGYFRVSPETRERWSSNGASKRIGPDALGEWKE